MQDTRDGPPPEETCGICMEDMRPLRRGQLDCCNHVFCEECIAKQFQYNSRCPLCRREFRRINGQLQHKMPHFFKSNDSGFSDVDVPLPALTVEESEERQRELYLSSGTRPKKAIYTDKTMSREEWLACNGGSVGMEEQPRVQYFGYFEATVTFVEPREENAWSLLPPPREQTIVERFLNKWSRFRAT